LTLDIGFGKSNDKHDGEPFDFGYMIWKRQWQTWWELFDFGFRILDGTIPLDGHNLGMVLEIVNSGSAYQSHGKPFNLDVLCFKIVE
jgi:hypothetical protein